jgi:hypothetical protein
MFVYYCIILEVDLATHHQNPKVLEASYIEPSSRILAGNLLPTGFRISKDLKRPYVEAVLSTFHLKPLNPHFKHGPTQKIISPQFTFLVLIHNPDHVKIFRKSGFLLGPSRM